MNSYLVGFHRTKWYEIAIEALSMEDAGEAVVNGEYDPDDASLLDVGWSEIDYVETAP